MERENLLTSYLEPLCRCWSRLWNRRLRRACLYGFQLLSGHPVWCTDNIELLLQITVSRTQVTWSPDGRQLVSVSLDNKTQTLELVEWRPACWTLHRSHSLNRHTIMISSDRSFIITSNDRVVQLWSRTTKRHWQALEPTIGSNLLQFLPILSVEMTDERFGSSLSQLYLSKARKKG